MNITDLRNRILFLISMTQDYIKIVQKCMISIQTKSELEQHDITTLLISQIGQFINKAQLLVSDSTVIDVKTISEIINKLNIEEIDSKSLNLYLNMYSRNDTKLSRIKSNHSYIKSAVLIKNQTFLNNGKIIKNNIIKQPTYALINQQMQRCKVAHLVDYSEDTLQQLKWAYMSQLNYCET